MIRAYPRDLRHRDERRAPAALSIDRYTEILHALGATERATNAPAAAIILIDLASRTSRTLRRVRVSDAEEAERTFHLLMGNDVAPRKDFLVTSSEDLTRERIDA